MRVRDLRAKRVILGLLGATVAVLLGGLLVSAALGWNLLRDPRARVAPTAPSTSSQEPGARGASTDTPAGARQPTANGGVPLDVNPRGHDHWTPATEVAVPPAPAQPALPHPREPPPPLTTRPPMRNPGGVNGDRPPRP